MSNSKYHNSVIVESIIDLANSHGWTIYKEDLVDRIKILKIQKDSLLSQHKDREAGEKLARQKELEINLNWIENKLKALKEVEK